MIYSEYFFKYLRLASSIPTLGNQSYIYRLEIKKSLVRNFLLSVDKIIELLKIVDPSYLKAK